MRAHSRCTAPRCDEEFSDSSRDVDCSRISASTADSDIFLRPPYSVAPPSAGAKFCKLHVYHRNGYAKTNITQPTVPWLRPRPRPQLYKHCPLFNDYNFCSDHNSIGFSVAPPSARSKLCKPCPLFNVFANNNTVQPTVPWLRPRPRPRRGDDATTCQTWTTSADSLSREILPTSRWRW